MERIHGLDLARALAVFGMAAVNLPLALGIDQGAAAGLAGVFSGRAAAVFVVLAGVGMSLMARGRPDRERAASLRPVQLKRALFLAVLGLGWMPLWPADILHYYAVWLSVGALLWRASDRALLLAAAGSVLAFPALLGVLDYGAGWDWQTLQYSGFWTPVGFLRNLLFNGFHPVFPWLGFLLGGMWLGRQDLRDPARRRRLARWMLPAWGTVELTALGMEHGLLAAGVDPEVAALVQVSPMPPMPTYMLGAGLLAALVILGSVALAERARPAALLAVGRHALSHYVGHVVLLILPLWVLQDLGVALSSAHAVVGLGLYISLGTLGSWAWSRRFKRGPLEAVMRTVSSWRIP